MVTSALLCLAASFLAPATIAAPLLDINIGIQLDTPVDVIELLSSELQAGEAVATIALSAIATELALITPTATPTSIPEITSVLSSAFAAGQTSLPQFIDNFVSVFEGGLAPGNITDFVASLDTDGIDNDQNNNTVEPDFSVYPYAHDADAPYSQSESTLRGWIYIPPTFTYGQIPPVILVPGTGSRGGVNYQGNFIKQLTNTTYADPVWLNPTGFMFADAQVNAEMVAYAVNYISGISGNSNVSIIAWSQGTISTQWTLKYWPSARGLVSNVIAISPDYHGTKFAELICPDTLPCNPAIIQQDYESDFITTLRSDGGDSAYVPTTTIYSAFFDEIVEPQQGIDASGYLLDDRGVGVSNNEIQSVCGVSPAGGFVSHEGALYNPLTYALAVDVLTNGGPGRLDRLDLDTVCNQIVAPGLDVQDVLLSEYTVALFFEGYLVYPEKVTEEPAIMSYAQQI